MIIHLNIEVLSGTFLSDNSQTGRFKDNIAKKGALDHARATECRKAF